MGDQFHCASALRNRMIDVNTLPFLPVADSTKQEQRAFAKTRADSLSYGHSLLRFFSTHIWFVIKPAGSILAFIQSETDTSASTSTGSLEPS